MGITTLNRYKIYFLFLSLYFFAGVGTAFAQCPTVSNPNQSFCDVQSPTISSLVATANGNGIVWYATATSTTPLTGSTGLISGEDYFADDNSGLCGTRQSVVVTIYSAPIGQNFQGVCVDDPSNATIADLIASGNNVQWYNVPTNGSPLPSTTVLVDNTIYYASQTNPITGCETSRLSVFVNVGVVPVPTGNATQTFCTTSGTPTVNDLVATGNNNWYLTISSASPLALSTPLINGQHYFATTVDPPCESLTRFETVVAFATANNSGTNGTRNICATQIATTPPFNLYGLLGGTPNNTGVWTGPLPTSNGFQGTVNVSTLTLAGSPYVFTYTVSTSVCAAASSTVTITIIPPANAGTNGTLTICSNGASQNLFSSLGGTPQAGGAWSPAMASGTGVFNPAVDPQGTYTYTVAGTAPCPNATAAVSVTKIPRANAGTNGTLSICTNGASQNLFNSLGGTPQAGGTWTPALASGTGVFNPAIDPQGTYTYTVIGTAPCANATATVVVTKVLPPNAGTNGTLSICGNAAAVNLFTLLGGTPQAGGTWTPAMASGTGFYNPAVDPQGGYTYTVTGTAPCANATATVTVTRVLPPNAGTNGALTICTNAAPQNLFSSLGGTPQAGGSWTPALASGTGVFNPAVDPQGTYTYTVTGTAPCAIATATVTVTKVLPPNAGTNGVLSICGNAAAQNLFTLLGGTPQAGGTWSPAMASGTGVFNPAVDPQGTYTYTVTGTAPCANATANVTVTKVLPPNAGTNGTKTFCRNAAAQNLFLSLGGTPQAGGTWTPALTSGTGVFNPAVDPQGTYTYTVTGTAPCANAVATVLVTTVLPPNAGTNGTLNVCSNAASQNLFTSLGGTPQAGGTWTPALVSGTGVFNPAVDAQGTYTYTVTGTAPCANATAIVNVTKVLAPNAGTNGSLSICTNAASQNLFTLLGGTPQIGGSWTPAMASGTGVFNPAIDPQGTYTYTVIGTAPCANANAAVTVTKVLPPNAGTSGVITLCSSAPSVNLFTLLGGSPQAGGTWTPTLASGTGVFNPAIDAGGTFTYTVTGLAPCANATSTVTVTKVQRANAGTNGAVTFCQNAVPQNLFNSLGGGPQPGGTWTPAMASGTGFFNPAVDPAGTYMYTVIGTAPCANATATVVVSKTLPPNAGTNGTLSICTNAAAQNLFTSLGGSPQAGGTWTPALASGTGVFNPAVDPAGTYTYTLIGTAPCANATSTVTVTKATPPNAGTNGAVTFCSSSPSQNLFSSLGGTPQAGGTWTPAMASGTGVFNPSVDPQGIYTYTVIGTAPCANATATVNVTKVSFTNAGTNGTLNICSNAAAQDLFNSLGGSPQAGGTWSPPMASNTGFFNPVVDAAGVYTYTVTGTAPCTNASATVTVTKATPPNAGTNGSVSFCSNSPSQNLFSSLGGTPLAGGTWTPAMASGTGVFNPAIDLPGTYSYTLIGTSPCANAVATVTVTIVLPPNPGTNGLLNICSNGAAQNLFNSLGGTPQAGGTWSPAMASGTGLFNPVVDAAGTYTYTVIGTPPCGNATSTVTVTKATPPNAGTNGSVTFCTNSPTQDLFTSLGGTPQAGGTWSPAMASGTGVFNPSVDLQGTYTYTVTGTAPCANSSATVTVIKILPPNAGTNGAVILCSNSPSTNLFSSLGGTPQSGGSWSPAMASGTGFFNTAVDAAGPYTYTVAGVSPCGSASATVSVTIRPQPIAGVSGSVTLCSNSSAQNLFPLLGGTAQAGGTWSPALASGTGVFNPALDLAGIYTYTVTGTAPCANASASITVIINQMPSAGADAPANICSNADPQDLFGFLTGAQAGGTWTPALASGTGFFNPAVDTAGSYTYTVTGTAPCGSDSSIVTVTITPGPDAGISGSAAFCVNSAATDLFLSLGGTPQVGGVWSPAMASGSGVFNPAVDIARIYTYTFSGSQPCADDTATVTVTINPIPDAGVDGTSFFCSNYAPSDLFSNLGGTPQAGGTWSPALASGTGVFNPLIDLAGTYTYSVGGGLCSTDTSTVTVSVTQSPNAGGLGATLAINTCVTTNSVNLFTALNGTQGVGTWNDNDSTGALNNNIFNPSAAGSGTYHFTYTVSGGTSPCLTDTATVTVIVAPVPNAGTFTGVQTVCNSTGTFNLFNLLNGNQTGGTWTDSSGAVVTSPVNISTLISNTYSFTYTITNTCGTDAETVQVTVLPNPVFAVTNFTVATPVCKGDNDLVSFSGMIDGTYNFNYDLSGANVLPGQTVSVIIASGVGSFLINSAVIPNIGTTTITFTNITNGTSACATVLTNVSANFLIRSISDLDSANLTIANNCLGSPSNVLIAGATGLPDGNYQFNFTIPQATPSTGTTGVVAIVGGFGQFPIPASYLATAGSYTLTINTITSLSAGCSNLNENATAAFQVFALPNTTGAVINAAPSCVNFSNQVFITGANNLTDGNYNLNYQLSGASTVSSVTTVNFVSGSGSFIISSTDLATAGNVTVTITQLISGVSLCGTSGTTFSPFTFVVTKLDVPTLIDQDKEYCASDNPKISDLTANASGVNIVWYNAPSGGTAYQSTDALVDLTTYYAAATSASGCESPTRLEVTVDFSKCPDILIPDGFSPNNDGINDEFVIPHLAEIYPNFGLEIYNRYGNILYKGNKTTPYWDGTTTQSGINLGSSTLPVGVYFYVLEFNDGVRDPKQGRIYLSR